MLLLVAVWLLVKGRVLTVCTRFPLCPLRMWQPEDWTSLRWTGLFKCVCVCVCVCVHACMRCVCLHPYTHACLSTCLPLDSTLAFES